MNLSVSSIADQVRDLAVRSDSADFGPVTEVINAVNEGRAKMAMRGLALLELPKLKARPFVLAYQRSDGTLRTARGVELPVLPPPRPAKDDDEASECTGYSVLIDDYEHPFYSHYKTMEELREYFERRKTPYYIAYAD